VQETSAKDDTGIREVFERVARALAKQVVTQAKKEEAKEEEPIRLTDIS
jgi:hypothetical protein